MADSFDALEFAHYLRRHWREVAVGCVLAVVLAIVASLIVPKRYTATAALMIEPPAGLDPRGATAVSPVYLESLRTYELLALSDTLFTQALGHLHIRQKYANQSIESLKRRVLAVSKPVNTRVIQIQATLEDPVEAQALAQYIAEQTVVLNGSMGERSNNDLGRDAQTVFENARARLAAAQRASDSQSGEQSDAVLTAQIDADTELRYQLTRDLGKAKEELAGLGPQDTAAASSLKARILSLEGQSATQEKVAEDRAARLTRLRQRHDAIDSELTLSRTNFESARQRVDELKAGSAFRGERLEILDPGIVPQRPTFPNLPLNVLIAFVVSLVGSVAWLAARFGYERTALRSVERAYRVR